MAEIQVLWQESSTSLGIASLCMCVCLFIYLFSFWLCWVFVAVRRLSLVATSRGYFPSQCPGLSVWSAGSRRVASVAAARGLSSCGAPAQLSRGMWDHPGPGIKPMSLALQGRFLTTGPPGKPFCVCSACSYSQGQLGEGHTAIFRMISYSCIRLCSHLNANVYF